MTDVDSYDELALPNGAEVLGVFVNGVPLVAGQDYDVMADRIHLTNPVRRRTSVSTVGKVLLIARRWRLQQGRRRRRTGPPGESDPGDARTPLR